MTIKYIFVCGVILSFCYSCGIKKYYTYQQPGDIYKYRDSLIVIDLGSLVDEDYQKAYVRLKKLTNDKVTIDYIKPLLYYYVSGKKVQAKVETFQVIRFGEMSGHHSFINPPVFENVLEDSRIIDSDKFTNYNFGLVFKDQVKIPKIDKVYMSDSIGYSVNGKTYHFVKEIELIRRTKRYFWFLRDD